MAWLRRRGVRYVLIRDADPVAYDAVMNAAGRDGLLAARSGTA